MYVGQFTIYSTELYRGIAKKGWRDLDKQFHFQHWYFKYSNYIGSLNANFCSKYTLPYIEYTREYALHY